MNGIAIAFLLVNATLLLLLPRRWAPLPLLVGTCYMTAGQGVDLGPFSFSVIRILLAVGVLRIILRGERVPESFNGLDKLMISFAGWALTSSLFHKDVSGALVWRLGFVYNTCGIYFLIRVFCQSIDDILMIFRLTGILLAPLALEMLWEKATAHNLFSVFGGVAETPALREGSVRAQGPFAHSILAGTVGAVSLPMMVALWRQYRKQAVAGIVSCFVIVLSTVSSGPIMSSLTGIGALLMWRYRHHMRLVRWVAVLGYICLDVVMKAPAYFIMARIMPIASSSGWHRARLIESAFSHINEWWLGGTDYTRHWMPTGVSWSADHTDITNYYIKMGVIGGLPLMVLLILIFAKGFAYVGNIVQQADDKTPESRFTVWTLGASLFAHAVTCISVSYFDQSFLFLYLTLATISSAWSSTVKTQTEQDAKTSL